MGKCDRNTPVGECWYRYFKIRNKECEKRKLIDADTLIIKVKELIKEYERRMPEYSANDMLTSGKYAAMKWGYKADGVEDVLKLIADAPIIKTEPIKHGQWIAIRNGNMKHWKEQCSVCGRITRGRYPYCRNCGARMDGDVNE